MKTFSCIVVAAALQGTCSAQTNWQHLTNGINWSPVTFTTLNGVVWSNAKVRIVEGDAITVITATSGARIPFTNLPPDIVQRFYIPELAAEHTRQENERARIDEQIKNLQAMAEGVRRHNEQIQRWGQERIDELQLPLVRPGPVHWKILERDYGWTRFSFQVALTNIGSAQFSKAVEIHFLDQDGFQIEREYKYPVRIGKKEVFEWTGTFEVRDHKANQITQAKVEVHY